MIPVTALTANVLRNSARTLACAVVERMEAETPGALRPGLPRTFAEPVDDTEVRLLHLAESVAFARSELLQHAIAWYKVAFHHRGVDAGYLPANLRAMGAVLRAELPPSGAAVAVEQIERTLQGYDAAPVDLPSSLRLDAPHGSMAANFLLEILEGDGDAALRLLREALGDGLTIADLHDHVLTPVQQELGRMWVMAEVPIADEHYGSGVVDRLLWSLQDRLPEPPADAPTVTTLGVGGNLHEFGLRMVAQRLQLAGYRVNHLGANMPASDLEWALQERDADLIAMSATLSLHLSTLQSTIGEVRRIERAVGDGRRRPILVGGAIFGRITDLHRAVGADACAADAAAAVRAVRELLANHT